MRAKHSLAFLWTQIPSGCVSKRQKTVKISLWNGVIPDSRVTPWKPLLLLISMSSGRLNHTPRISRIFKPHTWKYEKPFETQSLKISIQVHWRRLASGSFHFPWLSPTPAPSPSVNRANQAHLRRPHLFHGTKIPETLAQTQTADWIPHFSPCTAHPMRSFKLETTFYVNASLKLYCLPIIFIGFAMHLWKRF